MNEMGDPPPVPPRPPFQIKDRKRSGAFKTTSTWHSGITTLARAQRMAAALRANGIDCYVADATGTEAK